MATPRDAYNAATDSDSPAFECAAYKDMLPAVVIVNDCFAGTDLVSSKSEYLPRYGAETTDDYNARLASSKFWNAFRRTDKGLVGLIFRKPLKIEAAANIVPHLEDVDMQGSHVDVFSKERCERGITDGHTFIYVDMPPSVLSEKPNATLADEISSSRRPYWVPVNLDQVVNWRTERVGEVEKLTQVTIRECVIEPAGMFGEEEVIQYRVLRPGEWAVYRENAEDGRYYVYESGATNLSYIPLVPFYAMQVGFFTSTPPLLDVAHENLRHYRLQSSLDRVLDLCNVPTPVLIGRNDDSTLIVGNGVIDIPIGGDAKFLEPTGNAIATTQNEIDRCKSNIASLGLLLLSGQPTVTKTATETTVEHTAETSELAAIARSLQDCLNRCLKIHADYMGLPDGGMVEVNRDFIQTALTAQDVTAISSLVEKNQLSLETMWDMLKQGEWLPDDFDAKDERAAVDTEKEANASLTQTMFTQFDRGMNGAVSQPPA